MVKIQTVSLENKIYPLGFKVVTENLESLGLRQNPYILTYPVNRWYFLESDKVLEGPEDFGGIWVARTLSNARKLKEYMRANYSQETRIFRAALADILYYNNYRIKTQGINLFQEV